MLQKIVCATAFVLLLQTAAPAQSRRRRLPPPPPIIGGGAQDSRVMPMGEPEAEMLKRAEIENEKESHKEMVERAEETVRLGLDLRAAFGKYKALSREDLRQLERMEKLARKIRGGAGGDDDKEALKDPPAQLEQAVARIAELSEKLGESVRKSSRFVVSGAVIEQSNELIELIRHVRSFVKQ